ncbi:hypothetical protein [Lentibacillus salinarum]|uniref:Lysozyme inhibitor LprI N-terminal domain-containing protein n=1 Tax=Lentibacillus salinarum TaxID=446820 RepID=A0ABW3ZUA0_9BACI
MKHFIKLFLGVLMLSVFLVACGSIESKIIGSWKVVIDDDVVAYLEIDEERIINRQESNDNPMTADYILTETEDDNFIMEVVNPEDGTNEFFFEGYFENKNTVIVVDTPGGAEGENNGLVRIDSVKEEMEKDKEAAEAKAAEEEKKKELAKEKEEEEKAEQRAKEKEENEKAKQLAKEKREKEAKQLAAEASDLKKKYLQKADVLDDRIMKEAKEIDPDAQDMRPGFYGQYYNEWDDLLQNVWDELEDTMPKDAFEKLKSDQIEWIEMKEEKFDEMPDETASARGKGVDYLAFETKDRTYYLIEDYMD